MKWYILFFSVIVLGTRAFCQVWPKIYFPNNDTYGYEICESYDHGVLIVGTFLETIYPNTGFIMKTDINGDLLWYKQIGIEGEGTTVVGVDTTSDKGIIIIGSSTSLSGEYDPFIIKFNSCLEKQWCNFYPSTNNTLDAGRKIHTLPDGGYIAMLRFYGNDEENQRIWLFRLDNNGALVWQKYYGQSDTAFIMEMPWDMIIAHDTSIIVSGYCYYPQIGQSGYWLRPYLLKTNLDGLIENEIPWTNNEFFIGYSYRSIIDNKNKMYSCVRHSRYNSPSGASPTVIFTGSTGEQAGYTDLIPNSELAVATTINWFADSSIIVGCGWTMPSALPLEGVIKLDTSGNIIDSKVILTNDNSFFDAQTTFDNKLFLAIAYYDQASEKINTYAYKINSNLEYDSLYSIPLLYDYLCSNFITTDTVLLDCNNIVNIEEPLKQIELTSIKVFPNPATEYVIIEFPNIISIDDRYLGLDSKTYYRQWDNAVCQVIDLKGHVLFNLIVNSNTKSFKLPLNSWSSGIYMIRLNFNNRIVAQSKFIKT